MNLYGGDEYAMKAGGHEVLYHPPLLICYYIVFICYINFIFIVKEFDEILWKGGHPRSVDGFGMIPHILLLFPLLTLNYRSTFAVFVLLQCQFCLSKGRIH